MELAYTPLGKAYSPCINKGQMFQRWGEQEWQVVQQKGIWGLIGCCQGGQGHQWDETDHEKKKNNTYRKRRARKENGKGISRTHSGRDFLCACPDTCSDGFIMVMRVRRQRTHTWLLALSRAESYGQLGTGDLSIWEYQSRWKLRNHHASCTDRYSIANRLQHGLDSQKQHKCPILDWVWNSLSIKTIKMLWVVHSL